MGCRSVQVQLNIGLYAKSSYRGFLVAPYDSVARRWGADSSLVCTERELFERQVKNTNTFRYTC